VNAIPFQLIKGIQLQPVTKEAIIAHQTNRSTQTILIVKRYQKGWAEAEMKFRQLRTVIVAVV
jgi:hypothetical protein